MKEVLVVIGHRMGKGQAVARGVEKAGGRAIVIPGMAADMKLGDVMHKENADLGISFCGSGGSCSNAAAWRRIPGSNCTERGNETHHSRYQQ